jgi:hypothetical protein
LQSIDPSLDLGNGLTLQGYAALIAASNTLLQTYNLALAEADRARIEFAETEASISGVSSRILSAIVAMYGKDSKEYELAGGKPPGNYRRAKKTAPVGDLPEPQPSQDSPDLTMRNVTSSNGAERNGVGDLTQF